MRITRELMRAVAEGSGGGESGHAAAICWQYGVNQIDGREKRERAIGVMMMTVGMMTVADFNERWPT
jgi:hypothetical protein